MVATKSILFAIFCTVTQLSSAGTPHLNRRHEGLALRTNAERMAAGLNPLPPRALDKRTWNNWGGHDNDNRGGRGNDDRDGRGGRNDDDRGPSHPHPSPLPPAPEPTRSPPPKRDVKIKCKRADGHGDVGWIGKDFSSKDRNKKGFGLCTSRDRALDVSPEGSSSSTPFDVKIPSRSDYPFLGWVGNNLGSGNSCVLTGTRKTNINTSPSNVGNAFSSWAANSESQVWYLNSKRFSSKWVNTGGQRTESKTFYNPDEDLFHLVTDTRQFLRRCPRAFEVEFELDD